MNIPPRPSLIPEQLRAQADEQLGDQPRVMTREQSANFAAMLATNLQRMLNDEQRLPWIRSRIEQRDDGFSLHVDLLDPIGRSDIDVL